MEVGELTGETLAGRFRIEERIGQGGYGAVFRAIQLSVDRECAIKVLAPRLVSDESVVERFRVEAKTTSSLSHPNTVVLYDFGRDEERSVLFLAMELLQGESLRETVEREGPLPIGEVGRIADRVAGSLQEAHDAGTVHRDVKPGNIMLVERGGEDRFVKVIDFGIAKAVREDHDFKKSLTGQGMMVGTPAYMSPEQVRSDAIGGSTDQYALAMTVYFAVAGSTPFHGGTSMEVASRHLTKEPTPLSEFRPELALSNEVDEVLLRALSKDPAERFDSVEAFADAFRGAVEESEEITDLDSELEIEPVDGPVGGQTVGGGPELATTAVDADGPSSRSGDGDGGTVAVAAEEWSGASDGAPGEGARPTKKEEDAKGLPVRTVLAVAAAGSAFVFAVVVWAVVIGELGVGGSEAVSTTAADTGATESGRAAASGTASGASSQTADGGETSDGGGGGPEDVGGPGDTVDTARDSSTESGQPGARAGGRPGASEDDTAAARGGPSGESAGGESAGSSTVVVRMIPWGTLYVDGEEVGRGSRVSLQLTAGRHQITMRQNGEPVAERTLRVKSGARRQIELAAP